jgi:hypothetical protein
VNIYQRINAVMKKVEYVQKDAVIQGYKAVTHDNVTAVLRPHLVAQGIVVRVDQLRGEVIDKWQSKNGSNFHRYTGEYAVHFVNAETPEDVLTVTVQAHADDNADKAPGKAMSYATKYAMLKTFSLETGENEEGRYSEPYTPEQLEVFHELVEQEKAYEFFLFVSTLPPETVAGLNSSFPDGKKTSGKAKVKELSEAGHALFRDVVEDVQARLANQDPSVIEVTDEMSVVEKKFLASRLTDFEVAQLKKMKEAAA